MSSYYGSSLNILRHDTLTYHFIHLPSGYRFVLEDGAGLPASSFQG